MKPIWSCLSALALISCQTIPYSTADAEADAPMLTEDRRLFMLSEFERQKRLWSEAVPPKYTYQIETSCFCFPAPARGPNEIRVENNVVVGRVYIGENQDGYETGAKVPEKIMYHEKIEELFSSIRQHLKPPSEQWFGPDVKVFLTVEYDSSKGFPKEIYYGAENVLDAGCTVSIDNFNIIE